MATFRKIFEQYSFPGTAAVSTAADWRGFERSVIAHGLSSDSLQDVFSTIWTNATSSEKPIDYVDLATTIMPHAVSEQEARTVIHDLQQDASALRRFVEYVQLRYKKDSAERRNLDKGLETVADAYRATLLHLLRLAIREADAIDALQRTTLLLEPIEKVLKEEAGPYASMSSSSLAPSPFEFQRVHCVAINNRLATVYVKNGDLVKNYRLYRTSTDTYLQNYPFFPHSDQLLPIKYHSHADKIAPQFSPRSDSPRLGTGTGAYSTYGNIGVHGSSRSGLSPQSPTEGRFGLAKEASSVAEGNGELGVEIYHATRTKTSYEDCSIRDIPFEIEVRKGRGFVAQEENPHELASSFEYSLVFTCILCFFV